MIDVTIKNPETGITLSPTVEGAMPVVVHSHPPVNENINSVPLSLFMTNDSDSSDMNVNGATTSVQFKVRADADNDTYISSLTIKIADAAMDLNEFGSLAPLTTGCRLSYTSSDLGEETISESLKTNFDIVRLSGGNPAFGTNVAFIAGNVDGTSEGIISDLDFKRMFGVRYGIRLRRATNDALIFTINDDLSTIDAFDIIAYGQKVIR